MGLQRDQSRYNLEGRESRPKAQSQIEVVVLLFVLDWAQTPGATTLVGSWRISIGIATAPGMIACASLIARYVQATFLRGPNTE